MEKQKLEKARIEMAYEETEVKDCMLQEKIFF